MTKRASNTVRILFVILTVLCLSMLMSNILNEGYLGIILIRSISINDILVHVNSLKFLDKIYLVSLVKSMSDASISISKFLSALELRHIIVPMTLLLIFDLNRVYFKKTSVKVAIAIYVFALLGKYVIIGFVALFISPFTINTTILFAALGFTLLVNQVLMLVCGIILFVSAFKISRKEEVLC